MPRPAMYALEALTGRRNPYLHRQKSRRALAAFSEIENESHLGSRAWTSPPFPTRPSCSSCGAPAWRCSNCAARRRRRAPGRVRRAAADRVLRPCRGHRHLPGLGAGPGGVASARGSRRSAWRWATPAARSAPAAPGAIPATPPPALLLVGRAGRRGDPGQRRVRVGRLGGPAAVRHRHRAGGRRPRVLGASPPRWPRSASRCSAAPGPRSPSTPTGAAALGLPAARADLALLGAGGASPRWPRSRRSAPCW